MREDKEEQERSGRGQMVRLKLEGISEFKEYERGDDRAGEGKK